MGPMYYIGLDVHKRKIGYCVKDNSGRVFAEGLLSTTRLDLDLWMKTLPQPWSAAMEATMFTGWTFFNLYKLFMTQETSRKSSRAGRIDDTAKPTCHVPRPLLLKPPAP